MELEVRNIIRDRWGLFKIKDDQLRSYKNHKKTCTRQENVKINTSATLRISRGDTFLAQIFTDQEKSIARISMTTVNKSECDHGYVHIRADVHVNTQVCSCMCILYPCPLKINLAKISMFLSSHKNLKFKKKKSQKYWKCIEELMW